MRRSHIRVRVADRCGTLISICRSSVLLEDPRGASASFRAHTGARFHRHDSQLDVADLDIGGRVRARAVRERGLRSPYRFGGPCSSHNCIEK